VATSPLTAVPAYVLEEGRVTRWDDEAVASPLRYIAALHRAGAQEAIVMPVLLGEGNAAERLLARFDGLVLLGGGDLAPSTYGQQPHERVYGVSEVRDAFELGLARAAIALGTPTLAICRGHQILNVALGGTLDQHITDRLPGHGRPGTERGTELHDISLEPGSRLAAALGVTRARCSSHHHQAVDRLGRGLRATAWAEDGVIEGVELDGDGWVVGAQWHPEDTAADDPVQQRLFDAFATQASSFSSVRSA
jgi:putative glutamine amidotransferase